MGGRPNELRYDAFRFNHARDYGSLKEEITVKFAIYGLAIFFMIVNAYFQPAKSLFIQSERKSDSHCVKHRTRSSHHFLFASIVLA